MKLLLIEIEDNFRQKNKKKINRGQLKTLFFLLI